LFCDRGCDYLPSQRPPAHQQLGATPSKLTAKVENKKKNLFHNPRKKTTHKTQTACYVFSFVKLITLFTN
jgi:hypothetical protein